MMVGLVFGGKCTESLASYDQESRCWKTCQHSLFEESKKFLGRWPKSGMMQNGVLYQQAEPVVSGHHTNVKDCSLLPTPLKSDVDKHGTGGLVRRITYPEGQKRYSQGDYRNLPTPTKHLHQEYGSPSEWNRKDPSLITHFIEPGLDTGERPRLHPPFVEWMMGYPIGWTSCEHSEMQLSLSVQSGLADE